MAQGGRGTLLGGVPGVDPGTVVAIAGGVVGTNAAKMACGLGAKVYILDMNLNRLRYLSDIMPANCVPLASSPATIRRLVKEADVFVGAVLVDVAIDQGGCFETSKATTHCDPTFTIDGVVHYCVANMPGAVPKTSTWALTNATLPYAVQIASQGCKQAAANDPAILSGLNVVDGKVVYKGVCDAFGLPHTPVAELF